MNNKDKMLLSIAEIQNALNNCHGDLEEFAMNQKLTRARELRRHLRHIRELCKNSIDVCFDYEKEIRKNKQQQP